METVGKLIKGSRLEKNIILEVVSNELKISKEILIDIENDNFPDYLDQVFIIGHIRSYAKYLELDRNEITSNFKIQTDYSESDQKKEISKPVERINIFSLPKSISYLSVITFSVGFYFLFLNSSDFQSEYAMTPDVPENLIYNLEKIEMELYLSKEFNNQDKEINIVNQKKILEKQSNTFLNSSSVNASTPNNEKFINLDVDILLKIINPTWIQLRDSNDNIILSKLMDEGDEYLYQISDNYSLTAGNAGNIIVTLGNVVLGRVGKLGEVVDSLTINQDFNK